ncbi:MAG: hypothetical protein KDI06_06020 [Calditrichaeota bacterium]|nr:hypothetical protein [Calditrichota bacterium]HQU71084.1 hypothetical protein [Calditrichia bacterium]
MLHSLKAIISTEMKLIWRDWLFRIFAVLALLLLGGTSFGFFSSLTDFPYAARSIPAAMPYYVSLIFNVAQIVVMAFLATDILKRDQKFDTLEVVFIRPLDNHTILLGRALAMMLMFLLVNLLVLTVALVINLAFSDLGFQPLGYLIYPFLLAVPSMFFTVGLAFLLMQLSGNQAVSIAVLIGTGALSFFFLGERWHHLGDLAGWFVPMLYSEITGFSGFGKILLQRSIYVLLGWTFLSLTIIRFKRLPQSRLKRNLWGVFSLLFLGASLIAAWQYWRLGDAPLRLREEMRALNAQYRETPVLSPLQVDLEVRHLEERLEGKASLRLLNNNSVPLGEALLTLNPGLQVEDVRVNGAIAAFTRQQHLLLVQLPSPLAAGDSLDLQIAYRGTVNDQATYLYIREEDRAKPFRIWTAKADKRHAFLQSDYVLLPYSVMWYPMPGFTEGSFFPARLSRPFCRFSLRVYHQPQMTALSQGEAQADLPPGESVFRPAYPLPGISLTIGNYQLEEIEVDSLSYQVWRYPGHDFYRAAMDSLGDTLTGIIRDMRHDYENELGFGYPFDRLLLVETPVHYYAFDRVWTPQTDRFQPEQIWVPESGGLVEALDLKRIERGLKWRMERGNQTFTEAELAAMKVQRMLQGAFLGEMRGRFGPGGDIVTYQPDMNIFPLFFPLSNFVDSPASPYFNSALEGYLQTRTQTHVPMWEVTGATEMSLTEKASRSMTLGTLDSLLLDDEQRDIAATAVAVRGEVLFKTLQGAAPDDQTFNEALSQFIEAHRFQSLPLDSMGQFLSGKLGINFDDYLATWQRQQGLPGFLIGNLDLYQTIFRGKLRYQVFFEVENPEIIPGILEVQFSYGRGFGPRRDQEETVRVFELGPGEKKRMGMILDQEPSRVVFNTIFARNLPIQYAFRFEKAERRRRARTFEGEELLDKPAPSDTAAIVVDNLDSGFRMINPPQESLLRKWVIKDNPEEEDFGFFNVWRPSPRWELIKNATFYGKFVHSAYYVRGGGDAHKAIWEAELPVTGRYRVYTYVFEEDQLLRPWERRRASWDNFHYRIFSADGEQEAELPLESSEPGWQLLGTFYFNQGEARVELTNSGDSFVVIADAIKFVPVEVSRAE